MTDSNRRRINKDFPSPELPFHYSSPPVSGNEINGLGKTHFERAVQVFHGSGARELEWRKLELFFALINPFRVYWLNLVNRWMLRRADGPIAKTRVAVEDPGEMTDAIKAMAMRLGAGAVGIAPVTEKALYKDYQSDYPNAVVILIPMDSDEMAHVTTNRAGAETMRAYMEITRTVIALSLIHI